MTVGKSTPRGLPSRSRNPAVVFEKSTAGEWARKRKLPSAASKNPGSVVSTALGGEPRLATSLASTMNGESPPVDPLLTNVMSSSGSQTMLYDLAIRIAGRRLAAGAIV